MVFKKNKQNSELYRDSLDFKNMRNIFHNYKTFPWIFKQRPFVMLLLNSLFSVFIGLFVYNNSSIYFLFITSLIFVLYPASIFGYLLYFIPRTNDFIDEETYEIQEAAFYSIIKLTFAYHVITVILNFGIFLILKFTGIYSQYAVDTDFSQIIFPTLHFWNLIGVLVVIILNYTLCFFHLLICHKSNFLIIDKEKMDRLSIAIKWKKEIFVQGFGFIQFFSLFYFHLQFMFGNTGFIIQSPLNSPLFYLIPIQLLMLLAQLLQYIRSKKNSFK